MGNIIHEIDNEYLNLRVEKVFNYTTNDYIYATHADIKQWSHNLYKGILWDYFLDSLSFQRQQGIETSFIFAKTLDTEKFAKMFGYRYVGDVDGYRVSLRST